MKECDKRKKPYKQQTSYDLCTGVLVSP